MLGSRSKDEYDLKKLNISVLLIQTSTAYILKKTETIKKTRTSLKVRVN